MYMWYHKVFFFFWLISLTIMPSRSIHIVTNGRTFFFVMISNVFQSWQRRKSCPLPMPSSSVHCPLPQSTRCSSTALFSTALFLSPLGAPLLRFLPVTSQVTSHLSVIPLLAESDWKVSMADEMGGEKEMPFYLSYKIMKNILMSCCDKVSFSCPVFSIFIATEPQFY